MIAAAWWLFLFGLWPLLDPGHSGVDLASRMDIAIHIVGAVVLYRHYIA